MLEVVMVQNMMMSLSILSNYCPKYSLFITLNVD